MEKGSLEPTDNYHLNLKLCLTPWTFILSLNSLFSFLICKFTALLTLTALIRPFHV